MRAVRFFPEARMRRAWERQRALVGKLVLVSIGVHAAAFALLPGMHSAAAQLPELQVFLERAAVVAPAVQLAQQAPLRMRERHSPPRAHAPPVHVAQAKPLLTSRQDTPPVRVQQTPPAPAIQEQPALTPPVREAAPITAPAQEPARTAAAGMTSPAARENVATTPPRFDAAYLRNAPPPYPVAARRDNEEGTVTLKVLVSVSGRAAQVQLERSSGYPILDRAAMDAVRNWQFVPARRGNDAIESWVLVPVVFKLATG